MSIKATIQKVWATIRTRASGTVASLDARAGGSDALRKCLGQINLPAMKRSDQQMAAEICTPVDPDVLNARIRIGREPSADSWRSVLIVEICGTIKAPDEDHEVGLEVSFSDVTDETAMSLPVLTRPKHGPLQNSSHFVHRSGMGKLCRQTSVLEDWTVVAQVSPEWFVLPRQGSRRLQGNVAIVSSQTGARLASASCIVAFENTEIGYLDIEDNIQRAKTLAVGLAFSVGAANGLLLDPEVSVIAVWVKTNFGSAGVSADARTQYVGLRPVATPNP